MCSSAGHCVSPSAVFAFSGTYTLLFIARALQGVGSSFSSVAGEHVGSLHAMKPYASWVQSSPRVLSAPRLGHAGQHLHRRL